MPEDSYLGVRDGKVTSYVGPDATRAFQAIAISHALRFYAKTGMRMNRDYTPTRMLRVATSITRKTYKRNNEGYIAAADDLQCWANLMKSSLPTREGE